MAIEKWFHFVVNRTLASKADSKFQSKANSNSGESSMSFVSSRFAAFTCDHVVPSSNVMVKCLSFGPGKSQKFDFRHQSRMAPALCQELGRALEGEPGIDSAELKYRLEGANHKLHIVMQEIRELRQGQSGTQGTDKPYIDISGQMLVFIRWLRRVRPMG